MKYIILFVVLTLACGCNPSKTNNLPTTSEPEIKEPQELLLGKWNCPSSKTKLSLEFLDDNTMFTHMTPTRRGNKEPLNREPLKLKGKWKLLNDSELIRLRTLGRTTHSRTNQFHFISEDQMELIERGYTNLYLRTNNTSNQHMDLTVKTPVD